MRDPRGGGGGFIVTIRTLMSGERGGGDGFLVTIRTTNPRFVIRAQASSAACRRLSAIAASTRPRSCGRMREAKRRGYTTMRDDIPVGQPHEHLRSTLRCHRVLGPDSANTLTRSRHQTNDDRTPRKTMSPFVGLTSSVPVADAR